jgi:hypothetical protein
MSQQMADVFSEAIAEHPQDWHMLQRVFTADLDPARLRKNQNHHSERSVADALGQVSPQIPPLGSGT